MSSVDNRIVNMEFNNSKFQKNVDDSLSSIDKLKKGLNFDGQSKSLQDVESQANKFSLAGMAAGIDNISSKFSALGVATGVIIGNITTKALAMGTNIAKQFTLEPIMDGFHEYELQINSIQTILANTASEGSTLKQVSGYLSELNTYADKTIYDFSQMTANIGTFTAAGVNLKTSVADIKGIANLAALSGSNAQQASTAMYQLSQAVAAGKVTLMDWNSVVNAGMGGKVFQDSLIETARVHGVAIDKMIKDEGSFRNTLQDGWLTSDILNETLSKFTGDLNAQQLKTMGYNDQQITQIMKQAKLASDAATKVKTFTQLIGTLQEAEGSGWAQTWQILLGNFNEAKKLYTGISNVLGNVINDSANARNNLLQGWKDLGGRKKLIDAFWSSFNAIYKVLQAVQKAFRAVFPPATAKQLYDITSAIADFANSLIPTTATFDKLKIVFQAVFTILRFGTDIIGAIAKQLFKIAGAASGGAGGLLDFLVVISKFIIAVGDSAERLGIFNKAFGFLGDVIAGFISLLIAASGAVVDFFKSLGGADTSGLKTFGQRVNDALEPLGHTGEVLQKASDAIANFGRAAGEKLAPIFGKINEIVGKALGGLMDRLSNLSFSDVLTVINGALAGGIFVVVKKFVQNMSGIADSASGMIGSIKKVFTTLTDTLQAMQSKVKAQVILNIGIAVALLAASLVALSMIDAGKLTKALIAVSVLLWELVTALQSLTSFIEAKGAKGLLAASTSLVILAVAMDVLASAVTKMGKLSWNELAKGLTGVSVGLVLFITAAKMMDKLNIPSFAAAAASMLILSSAMYVLAGAVAIMGHLKWEEIAKGLTTLAGSLAIIAGASYLLPKDLALKSVGLVVAATGITILAGALKILSTIGWGGIAKSLTELAGSLAILAGGLILMQGSVVGAAALIIAATALTVLAGAMKIMGSMSWASVAKGLVLLAGSLLILAGGLTIMQGAIPGAAALTIASIGLLALGGTMKVLGSLSWAAVGKGLTVLAVSLGILAVGLTAMLLALPGAMALTVAAKALAIFVPVLAIMGSLNLSTIVTGLATMGAALGILAVAGVALLPAIPGLLGLGAAMVLIGAGALTAGIGIGLLATGLTSLANAGTAGATALGNVLNVVANSIPLVLEKVGEGIGLLATQVAQNGPALTAAFTATLIAMLGAVDTAAPQIIQTAVNLVVKFAAALADGVPKIVDSGLKLLEGLLQGISDHISSIVVKASEVIENFLSGLGKGLPKIIQGGVDLIINFINGISDAIDKNSKRVGEAGGRLAWALVQGMIDGIGAFAGTLFKKVKDMGKDALGALADAIKSHSPSRATYELGGYFVDGFRNAISTMTSGAAKVAANLGISALDKLGKATSGASDVLNDKLSTQPVISPVMDLSAVDSGISDISKKFGAAAPTLDVSPIYSKAVSAVQNADSGNSDSSKTSESSNQTIFDIKQYNTSPKPLDTIEVYRNTKNLMSTVKGALEKVDA